MTYQSFTLTKGKTPLCTMEIACRSIQDGLKTLRKQFASQGLGVYPSNSFGKKRKKKKS